ncbi:MAG: hypothetical protein QG653_673 [Patescibacteria group bacterium]|nr:hypothetical protein [Patescibacteria group bacterium]
MLILALVVIILGYFVFTRYAKNIEAESDTPMPQGKLNIDAVCEGALAYMSFPDGKSAETFVAECKEGKHPEVIEKFKNDMNLGDGAAI